MAANQSSPPSSSTPLLQAILPSLRPTAALADDTERTLIWPQRWRDYSVKEGRRRRKTIAVGCVAFDRLRHLRTLLRCLTERIQLRATLTSVAPPRRTLTFSECDRAQRRKISLFPNVNFLSFFFLQKRSDVAEVEKKKTRSHRRDSHTLSVRECVRICLIVGSSPLLTAGCTLTHTETHTGASINPNIKSIMKQMCHCIYRLNLITRDINKGSEGFHLKSVWPRLEVHVVIFFFVDSRMKRP